MDRGAWPATVHGIARVRPDLATEPPPSPPGAPLLGIYPKDLKAETQRGICTPMFITALFTIGKRWKQPNCTLNHKWINRLECMHPREYYSALKRKEIQTHATTRVKIKGMLIEISQSQKNEYCMKYHLHEVHRLVKFRDRKQNNGCQRLHEGEWEINGYRVLVWGDEKCFGRDGSGDSCTTM